MKKNILILSTSPRKNGNSEMLAREFARGAEEAGHNVELLSLHDKTIGFCKGCLACQKTQRCVIHGRCRRHRPKNEGRRGNRIRHPHLFL